MFQDVLTFAGSADNNVNDTWQMEGASLEAVEAEAVAAEAVAAGSWAVGSAVGRCLPIKASAIIVTASSRSSVPADAQPFAV